MRGLVDMITVRGGASMWLSCDSAVLWIQLVEPRKVETDTWNSNCKDLVV